MNQTLEDILRPVKFLDEAVLKQYTKFTKRWEAKGRSKYTLAGLLQLPTITTALITDSGLGAYPDLGTFALESLCLIEGLATCSLDMDEKYHLNSEEVAERKKSGLNTYFNVSKGIRLPLFISGVGLIVKGGLDLMDYIRTQNPESLKESLFDMSMGYTLLGNASSMYVRDSDPKLLDKTPAWRTAYDFVKGKISGLVPQPVPQPVPIPVPVRSYSSYDDGSETR